ncbi:cytochrome oxidase putative small subunit CydP [Dyella humicola]|uniref:cytochrome oxidase putative small subunit CydP n=1 Tax=Dyella humicola TaxID=2992126 RepID=UPI002255E9A1|nr:cytochrome oxidase putative small subunit CydP [Dyella humicola]
MSMQSADPVAPDPATAAWQRRPLRQLARKLILLVIAKIVLLTLIWWVAMTPYARPDTRPTAIEHLLAPAAASSTSRADSP